MKTSLPRRPIVALVTLLLVAGVAWRVHTLRGAMMSGWRLALDGGAVTTMATLDDWYGERLSDVEDMATALRHEGSATASFELFRAVMQRGRFTAVWALDKQARSPASASSKSLYPEERAAVARALATRLPTLTPVIVLGRHKGFVSFAVPVPDSTQLDGPRVVLARVNIVTAIVPWAAGRPNAALSQFVAPTAGGAVLISVCPAETVPVCLDAVSPLRSDGPSAASLQLTPQFGRFVDPVGMPVLAATRFDQRVGWGIVRRIAVEDAVVPLRNELLLEGGILAALLVLAGLGLNAVHREGRVRRLREASAADKRLATIVDASTDGLVAMGLDFRIQRVNAAVERLLGYHRAELLGRKVSILFPEEERDAVLAQLEAFAVSRSAETSLTNEGRVLRLRDGRTVPVDARVGRAELDGTPLFALGLRDISDRERVKRFLTGEREVLELVARGAPLADSLARLIQVVESEGVRLRCAIYQMEPDGESARLVASGSLPRGFVACAEVITVGEQSSATGTAMHTGEIVLSADIAHDERFVPEREGMLTHGIRAAWALPLRLPTGSIVGAITCYLADPRLPTARELELGRIASQVATIALASARSAASLRASEASFRSFVENAPVAIFRETLDGRIASANEALASMLGYDSIDALLAIDTRSTLYADPLARDAMLASLQEHGVVRMLELPWRRADGQPVAARISARAYRDDRGAVWLWEAFAEDVSPLRDVENALRRSERLAAVGQFISGIAHELNNPLSSILHFAEDLLRDERTTSDAEALEAIRQQARRSRSVVRDLLHFVRQRDAVPVALELAAVVDSTARLLRSDMKERGVTLEHRRSEGSHAIFADRAGLAEVVSKLVTNAAQAAGPGGEVTVVTDVVDGWCRLIVEDNGPGIPPDVMPRIFDPFFTTRSLGQGAGLGLSVVLGIVEQLGGTISAENRSTGAKAGARFVVLLPCVKERGHARERIQDTAPSAVASAPLAAAPASGAPRMAIIIDDEPTIRMALRRFFTRRGWTVHEAENGRSGLALIQSKGADASVILSDLRMPGFSGIQMHDELEQSHPELLRRLVFSTGDLASTEAANFVQRTRCRILEKPFELRRLDAIIADLEESATG